MATSTSIKRAPIGRDYPLQTWIAQGTLRQQIQRSREEFFQRFR
jgi:hypothetical protein